MNVKLNFVGGLLQRFYKKFLSTASRQVQAQQTAAAVKFGTVKTA